MRRDHSDSEVKALILDWLVRHGRWGAHYFPLDNLVNKLSHAVKNNGEKIKRAAGELLKQRYLFVHKKRNTVSLNPARNREIVEYLIKIMKLNSLF